MRAIVLAAGLGTRLGALSDERPKPLLPVCDIPLIRYNLALLAGHGIREVAINLHHRGDLIVAELSGERDVAITWSREERILGTGGALKRAAHFLTRGGRDPFLVLNGKLVVDVNLRALTDRHQETGAIATMAVREVSDAERWGAIDLDADDFVIGLLGQARRTSPFPSHQVARRTMFTGVHAISPEFLSRLPDGESCAIRQGYLPWLHAGAVISALRYDGYFQEHSTPARYLDGNRALLSGEGNLRFPPGPLTGADPTAVLAANVELRPPFRIGPGAHIGAGAVIGPHAVIGRRATVAAGARIEDAVVWPDALAAGPIARAIVTPLGTFPVGE